MNYLAHIALSGDHPHHRIGGLLGDFVRGPLRGNYPLTIEQGIYLHRKIDGYVDQQPELHSFLSRFEPPWRRYAGIVADVIYDHILARDWLEYCSQPLPGFCGDFYSEFENYELQTPPSAQRFRERAREIGWLESYASEENIPFVLEKIGQRLKRPVPLQNAFLEQRHLLPEWSAEFHQLYPRLLEFSLAVRSHRSFLDPSTNTG